jgi:hypothetical protein
MNLLAALRRRYGHSGAAATLWDVHIYNPRTQTTDTHRAVPFEGVQHNISEARSVIIMAARKFKAKQEYILAVPHRS